MITMLCIIYILTGLVSILTGTYTVKIGIDLLKGAYKKLKS